MKAKITDYYLNTHAEFKFIQEYDRNDIVYSSKQGIKLITSADLINLVYEADKKHIKNKADLVINFKSFNPSWHTGSFYLYNTNTKTIYRLSDHWSKSNSNKIHEISWINTCYWTLKINQKDLKKIVGKFKRRQFYNYQLAKCKLNKFEFNQNTFLNNDNKDLAYENI